MTDDHEILGVDADATAAEIKAAYRRRARALHPDLRVGTDPVTSTGAEFLRLAEARRRALAQRSVADARAARGGAGGRAVPAQRRAGRSATGRTPARDDEPMLALLTLPQRCAGVWPAEALEAWALSLVPAARHHLGEAVAAAEAAGAVGRHRTPATVHALVTLTLGRRSGRNDAPLAGVLASAYDGIERGLPENVVQRLPVRAGVAPPRRRTTVVAGVAGALVGGVAVWADLPGRLLG